MRFRIPRVLRLEWRDLRPCYYLCGIEFFFTVACLALFGIADPDTYRTKLWKEGFAHGWNSDPLDILYAIANYRPAPTPYPWAQNTTDYNVAISVLSMFALLAKTTLYILNGLPPFFSAFLHIILLALYIVSAFWQAGPDYLLDTQPSRVPWYLSKGCGPPVNPALKSSCQQAQACFAVAVCMCILFSAYLTWSVLQAIPTKEQKDEIRQEKDDEAMEPDIMYTDDEKWEYDLDQKGDFSDSPAIPMTPITPRTRAFNTLSGAAPHSRNRDLPLRHHISMGDDVYQSKN